MVELAERIGPDFGYWLEAPYDLALWCWHQLQDRDRARRWFDAAARLETAELNSLGYHVPKRLQDERDKLHAAARRAPAAANGEQENRGLSLARRLRRALSATLE